MSIIVTRYAQKNKDSVLCKRNIFKRGRLESIDEDAFEEQFLNGLLKGHKAVYVVNVEKKSDLDLKEFNLF